MMVNGEKERVSLLVSRGSVDAVSQQMASHPQYLESFLRTQHYILHMDGPLPLPYRHYIAIMVSDLAFLSRIHPNLSPAVIMQPNIHKAFFFFFLFWVFVFVPVTNRLQHVITATTWCTCTQRIFWGWAGIPSGCRVWRRHPFAFGSLTTLTKCWPTNPGSPPARISRYSKDRPRIKCNIYISI